MSAMPSQDWFWAGAGITAALAPCALMCLRGGPERRLVGIEMAGMLITIAMILFTMAARRTVFMDLPLTLAIMSFGGGLVYARFLEKHL